MPTYYAVADERYQPIGVALYRDRDEIRDAVIACEWAPPDDDDAIDAAVDSIIGAAVEIEAGEIGNGYFGSWAEIPTEKKTFCNPFVSVESDGIHVGDCDNDEVFKSPDAAREHVKRALLDEAALNVAARAWFYRAADNWAAEYQWHRDAEWQLSEIDRLFP